MVSRPHGGKLTNRVLRGKRRERLLEEAEELPRLNLSFDYAVDVENIARGVFSPLEGFMIQEEYLSVLYSMRLPDDTPWTIPVTLDVDPEEISGIKPGDDIALFYNDEPVALLNVEEIYGWEKKEFAEKVYKTLDINHPGVHKTLNRKELLLGGKIDLLKGVPSNFDKYTLWPIETRLLFREKGWRSVVGFQTRNAPHMGHEYVQKAALTFVDGLFVNPLVGWKKPGDYRDEVILAAYEVLIEHYYPKNVVVLAVLRTSMRYAGPREAVFHAIMRKNFGCTHFIVGRDHAGVGNYYGPYEAWDIFKEFPDLGVTPLFVREAFYCKKCGGMVNEKICPHSDMYKVKISGTKIREALRSGVRPPEYMMRPEVADVIMSFENPFVGD
ncbi:MAG: sulfate adenylyltransferase [Thermoprotei archaeon]|nr:MAG: sulfate adenylyltransferase [Thermoprotei archaeon]